MNNLVIEEKDWSFFSYPGGELQLRLNPETVEALLKDETDFVSVLMRIRGPYDVMRLLLLSNAIEGLSPYKRLDLILPYLPYARADRRFVDNGDCFGLETFGNLLGSIGPSRVITLDAHSQVANHKVPNLTDCSANQFIARAMARFGDATQSVQLNVLFPDKGAAERYNLNFGLTKVFYAEKIRNPETGKFEGFTVPVIDNDFPILIVDDICDGGGTFLGIAAELAKQGIGRERLGLYVTHGIFSKGFGDLGKAFSRIYCTDSFAAAQDIAIFAGHSPDLLTVLPCTDALMGA